MLGYFTSYFKEKGKNRALIEDTRSLTEEKEKVSSKYELDKSKRKYQYEYKSTQYFKYFNLLDELNTTSNQQAQEELIPILTEFNKSFLEANCDKTLELKATTELSGAVNKIMMKANESQVKFKSETNAIKLIAGDSVLKVLLEIEEMNKNAFDLSAGMMKGLGKSIIENNFSGIDGQRKELQEASNKLIQLKEELTKEIKKELNEI